MNKILVPIVKLYAWLVSPLFGQSCRFHPTCSAYCCQALERHGSGKGLALTIRRIFRCHPWHHGNFHDPVPQSIAWREIIGYKRRDENIHPDNSGA